MTTGVRPRNLIERTAVSKIADDTGDAGATIAARSPFFIGAGRLRPPPETLGSDINRFLHIFLLYALSDGLEEAFSRIFLLYLRKLSVLLSSFNTVLIFSWQFPNKIYIK